MKIMKCSCEHEYQDERYGKGMRAFNWGPKAYGGGVSRSEGWRCTVCEKSQPGKQEESK